MPSTCGMTTAESRDFRVATYSVVSSTFSSAAVFTFTGIACGPATLAALLLSQAIVNIKVPNSAIAKIGGDDLVRNPGIWMLLMTFLRLRRALPHLPANCTAVLYQVENVNHNTRSFIDSVSALQASKNFEVSRRNAKFVLS